MMYMLPQKAIDAMDKCEGINKFDIKCKYS